MTTKGYIKLWRQIRKSPVWVDEGALKLWLDLLMRVSHKPRKTVLKIGHEPVVVDLAAGQCAIRLRLAAQDLRFSVGKLQRRLNLLTRLGCIETAPTAKYVLVTVLNWEKYQQRTPEGVATVDTPSDTHHKKTKKTKKKERGAFAPPTPEEVTEYGKTIGFQVDGQTFCDAYQQAGWKLKGGNPMKDWQAAVRNWRNREKGRNGKPATTKQVDDEYGSLFEKVKNR